MRAITRQTGANDWFCFASTVSRLSAEAHLLTWRAFESSGSKAASWIINMCEKFAHSSSKNFPNTMLNANTETEPSRAKWIRAAAVKAD